MVALTQKTVEKLGGEFVDVLRLHADDGPDQTFGQIVESPRYFRPLPVRLVRHSPVHHDPAASFQPPRLPPERRKCHHVGRTGRVENFPVAYPRKTAANNARRLLATHSLIAVHPLPPKYVVCCPRLVTITTTTAVHYNTRTYLPTRKHGRHDTV